MGFRPPAEFLCCKKLLAPLGQDEIDQSLFGKDGKPLIIGNLEDLQRRSTRPLDLDSDEFEFILGFDPMDEDFEHEEDDHLVRGPLEIQDALDLFDPEAPDPAQQAILLDA